MCCDPLPARPDFTVGQCPDCGADIDDNGISTEEGCYYSPQVCNSCEDCPCDLSC